MVVEQLREWFDGGDLITFIAAVVAAVLSVWSVRRQGRLDRENLQLQERMARIEEARRAEEIARTTQADLRIEPRGPIPNASAHSLVVTNIGGATARDIDVDSLISRPTGKSPVQMNSPYPVASIHPGDRITSYVYVTWGIGLPFEATVSWTDPRGRQTKTQTLTPVEP